MQIASAPLHTFQHESKILDIVVVAALKTCGEAPPVKASEHETPLHVA